jgi:hypothetical protein
MALLPPWIPHAIPLRTPESGGVDESQETEESMETTEETKEAEDAEDAEETMETETNNLTAEPEVSSSLVRQTMITGHGQADHVKK